MKRSGIKPGLKSLERGSTFDGRGAGLKRRPRPRRAELEQKRSEAWARGVQSKPCVICGARGVHAHHVITKQQLRKVARQHGLDVERLLWDTRNRLAVCPRHHAAHHARSHTIPLLVIEQHSPKVFQLARELELTWWLEREYPTTRKEA